ncbi:MAG: CapA family protein [Spirochaetaceae bacterium]|jgi:poly-gamma-glutamate synthesis protein (capsule biosynthesis protein)|nr:CapA family protein [Spirochaetaceae bacterium]
MKAPKPIKTAKAPDSGLNPVSRTFAAFMACMLSLVIFAGCASILTQETSDGYAGDKNSIIMIAVGDNLIHEPLINNAWEKETHNYNFEPYYSKVKDLIQSADIAFVNQETLIAGEEFKYSGYPLFNGPKEIGDTLISVGFNVVNHATNHVMDKGEKAVQTVIDYWAAKPDVTVLGIYESKEVRAATQHIVECKNIKIGFLSYTYGLNGIPLPKTKPYLVSLIDTAVMAEEIDALRPLCDILVVSMHWGNEYEYQPSKQQEELASFLAEHNVDLVIGHHPHVLQPVRRISKADGTEMLCYFSLGNFISAQDKAPRLLGGMMRITIKRDTNKKAKIDTAELIPLVTHYEKDGKDFKVYFLNDYSDTLALSHGIYRNSNKLSLEHFSNLIKTIFGDTIVP